MARNMWALVFGILLCAGCAGGDAIAEESAKRRVPALVRSDPQPGGTVDVAAEQHIWVSNTGVWASTSSWHDAQIPGHGGPNLDTAILDGTSNVDVIGGTPGGNALYRIVTRPEYKGDIGAPSNPLVVQIASEAVIGSKAVFRGRGNVHYGPPAGTLADIVVDTGTQDREVRLYNNVQYVFVKSGKVVFADAGGLLGLRVLGENSHVSLLTTGMTLGEVRLLAGVVRSYQNNWNRIDIRGGQFHEQGYLDDDCDLVMYGGWMEYATTAAIAAHNPDIAVYGGTLDLRKLVEDLTATNLEIGPGASVLGNLRGQGQIGAADLQIDLREDYP